MKDQYFGDVNDYRKYGLLRALQEASQFNLLVAWMLTPDDGRSDGGFISYAEDSDRWRRFDPELFDSLRLSLADLVGRQVSLIEGTRLMPRTQFFSQIVPDERELRHQWSRALAEAAASHDLIFLDPDNGLEVPSRPLGRLGSSKYVYWSEIRSLWKLGASLLIYQHFPRQKRAEFIPLKLRELAQQTGAALVEAFVTPNVLFLLAAQGRHEADLRSGTRLVRERWADQIEPWGLLR